MQTIAPGFDLEVERGPDWLLVRVRSMAPSDPGDVSFAEHVWGLLQQHFTYRLVLELDGVGVLDSQLIGQLIQLYRRIERHDGVLRLCGLSAYNRQVLHTCRLDGCLPAYEDRQEAVMGRHIPTRPR
jgi:anti-anti-sigma factor